MKLIKLFLLLIFTISLYANNNIALQISKLSANSLYNLDDEQIKIVLKQFLDKEKTVFGLKIIDNTDNSIFVKLYKENNKLVFNKPIPKQILSLKQNSADIRYDGEIIGKLILYSKDKNRVVLTTQEQHFIDTHTVTIGVEQWSPIVFSNNGKDIDGLCGDFTKLIIKRTGLKVNIVNKKWDSLLDSFKNKKIDILPATYYTKDRAKYGLFSKPYLKMKNYLYVKDTNEDIKSFKDLIGKKLAIVNGYGIIDEVKNKFPNINIVLTKDLDDSINKVLNGEVDALYDGQIAVDKKIQTDLIKGLKYLNQSVFKAASLYYFIAKDKPVLHSIIQKALKTISYKQRKIIISKWLGTSYQVELNEDEMRWLSLNKEIKYAFDPHWKPIEWADQVQEPKGIISDVIKLIKQKSGINIKSIYSTSWDDVLHKVKTNKADMFLTGDILKDKNLQFTNNIILTSPYVFISRVSDDYLNGFKDLKGKKVGVFKNSSIHNILKENKLDKNLILFTSDQKALKMVIEHELDVVILSANLAKYYINMLGYKSVLKIGYKTKYNLELRFALNKSVGKIPLSIIDKTLKSISEKELSDIVYKWTQVHPQTKTDWALLGKIAGVLLLLIAFMIWNNRRLNIMVKEKTIDIENQKKELEELSASLEIKVQQRTKELDKEKKQVEAIHKHTRESIEYASLIQGAVVSYENELKPFFKDSFVHWEPKDTVGGDIWLFNELRHEDECLLFFIDCTGHGVPGAFVTMIVKAVEREIVSNLKKHPEFDISPAIIMAHFNKTMKILLKQETKDSLSNAGWDGGIIYYNRRSQILKFAGAETPLFYMTNDGEFKTIKGNRYSVGYKKCDINYEYKESIVEVQEGMKFYCTTDGYLDQNGGEKDFPFGKKRFGNLIKTYYLESMSDQKKRFLDAMQEYENAIENNDRNDDMTVIGFEIGKKSDFVETVKEEIVKYEGVITQNVIASCIDNIDAKVTNLSLMGTISTITIEYCQNMMNYSKNDEQGSRQIVPAGVIEVECLDNEYYEIMATNIVSIDDKEKIEPKLIEIQGLDKVGIKKRYRELRRSGENTHGKGGGIGMYEIAKVSDGIEYKFTPINSDKYYFTMKSIVKIKPKKSK